MKVSAVNEIIVREYFESLGYLVSQPRKYVVQGGRQKKADEEVDLVVMNPKVKEHSLPEGMEWGVRDLKTVGRAVVGIRGWHRDRFYVSTFEKAPDILRFVEADSIKFAGKILGPGPMARILCLPRLPASRDLKQKVLKVHY